jgi:hypothetical protein
MKDRRQTLFCPGMPGAGKTILASVAVEDLKARFWANSEVGIAYVYHDSLSRREQNPEDLFLSLIKQLVQYQSTLPRSVMDMFPRYPSYSKPEWRNILECLRSTIKQFSRVFLVVDALEECLEGCRRTFLREVFWLQAEYGVNIFVTSRFTQEIADQFESAIHLEIRANEQDLRKYLAKNMLRLPSFVRVSEDLQIETISNLVRLAKGRFVTD